MYIQCIGNIHTPSCQCDASWCVTCTSSLTNSLRKVATGEKEPQHYARTISMVIGDNIVARLVARVPETPQSVGHEFGRRVSPIATFLKLAYSCELVQVTHQLACVTLTDNAQREIGTVQHHPPQTRGLMHTLVAR